MQRPDDFDTRRKHLEGLCDLELRTRFWQLIDQIVEPLLDEAKRNTSPSVERSVLLRMGFSSLESKAIVERLAESELLGQGAGRLVLELAQARGLALRDAGLALMRGEHLEALRR